MKHVLTRMMRRADTFTPEHQNLNAELEDLFFGAGRVAETERGDGNITWSRHWEYPFAILESGLGQDLSTVAVADLGCGASPLLPYYAMHGAFCVGVDNDTKPDKGLWGYWPGDPNVLYIKADLLESGLPPDHFDVTFCISVIEHMVPTNIPPTEVAFLIDSVMAEMHRITAPGGRIIITIDYRLGNLVRPELFYEQCSNKVAALLALCEWDLDHRDDNWWNDLTVIGMVFQKE